VARWILVPPDDPPSPSLTDDPELAREREHLAHARTELARMRERTLGLDAHSGDRVSAAYLAKTLHDRSVALTDDPTTTLFFGRVDLRETEEGPLERWYIGRRHVHDEQGDPVVIDWRADMSTAFYRASRAEPMSVVLRRRFGLTRGRITAYEDEHLLDAGEHETASRILAEEIERPRVGPMRDIVATIQPEQDVIVRADAATTVCVQGAPGTGKTAVGLHRAAWLLYAHRARLARSGVLVIGPNRAFLDHIGAVLPALGEVSVRHTTIDDLVAAVPVRGTDPVETAVLKGDARLAEVVRRAVWDRVADPREALVVPRGVRRWRLPTYEVREILDELRTRGVRYAAAGAMLPQRLAHAVLLRMEESGEAPDDRVQDAIARSAAVRAYVRSVWPKVDPREILFRLLSDADELARHADGLLSPAEQALLVWPSPPRARGAARWSAADTVLLDEIADQVDRTPSLGHVVLDEAQDLSPMQLRAVGRRCSTGAATVLGDIAQGTTPWATDTWEESLAHLGKAGAHVEVLDRGFRVPALVIDYATHLLPSIAPGLGAPRSVRENPGVLDVRHVTAPEIVDVAVRSVLERLGEPGSVGIIAADERVVSLSRGLADSGIEHGVLGRDHGDVEHAVDVVPASVAKGLEFDRVVVVEPAEVVRAEPDARTGLRRLYVVLTRAVSELSVVHSEPLPTELGAAGPLTSTLTDEAAPGPVRT
jgi:DNA helicase IV